jgi:hypothetical protein
MQKCKIFWQEQQAFTDKSSKWIHHVVLNNEYIELYGAYLEEQYF